MTKEYTDNTYDSTFTEAEPWPGTVPPLDYWRFRYGKGVLTEAQAAYYKYLRDNTYNGRKVPGADYDFNYSYVSLLKDEIISDYQSKNQTLHLAAIDHARLLKKMYAYRGHDLDEILAAEKDALKHRRLTSLARKPAAKWIAVGSICKIGSYTTVRGGFYLGTHLLVSNIFDTPANKKSKSRRLIVEGPVIDTDIDPRRQSIRGDSFSTFTEMPEGDRLSLLNWLEGCSDITYNAAMYYLAGIEMRLLGDADTTNDERKSLIDLLFDFMELDIFGTYYLEIYKKMSDLADYCLSRFFAKEAIDIYPDLCIDHLPKLTKYIIREELHKVNLKGPAAEVKSRIADTLAVTMPVPKDFPEVYCEPLHRQLHDKLEFALNYRGRMSWYDESEDTYLPIGRYNSYSPVREIATTLKSRIFTANFKETDMLHRIRLAYDAVMDSIRAFLQHKRAGHGLIALAADLPSWCDPKKLPGAEKITQMLAPRTLDSYRMVPVSTVCREVGVPCSDEDPYIDAYSIIYKLRRFGLDTVNATDFGIKLKNTDEMPIFFGGHQEITTRGTFIISLYLLAWILKADTVHDSDLAIADRWIDDFDQKSLWQIPAKGALRWLLSHNITLSAKRKTRAATLAKTIKRRQEFTDLLLRLLSDPEKATPKRMKRVEAVYELLGLDSATIHTDMHRIATGEAADKRKKPGKIDKATLNRMRKSTEMAREMLEEVFTDDAPAKEGRLPACDNTVVTEVTAKASRKANTLAGIIARLTQKAEWPRSEFEEMCRMAGLTAGAVLEQINDLAYDTLDEGVADDEGDTIYIDTDLASQLI